MTLGVWGSPTQVSAHPGADPWRLCVECLRHLFSVHGKYLCQELHL